MKEIDFFKRYEKYRYEFYNLAKRRAKKEYKCSYCHKTIKKGETYIYYRDPKYEGLMGRPLFMRYIEYVLNVGIKNFQMIEKEIKKTVEEIKEQLKLLKKSIKDIVFIISNIYNKIKVLEQISKKSKIKNA